MGDRDDISGPDGWKFEMLAAAAGQLAPTIQTMSDADLLRRFAWAEADPDDRRVAKDIHIFVGAAEARDAKLLAADPATVTGRESWLPVWREAQQMIRVDMRPAVAAVADALLASCSLDYEQVAALASQAMKGPTA